MNEPVEFTSEIDRLKRAVADGEADALFALADELAMQGHPYGEELGAIAELANTTESPCVQASSLVAFLEITEMRESSCPVEVRDRLTQLHQLEFDEKEKR